MHVALAPVETCVPWLQGASVGAMERTVLVAIRGVEGRLDELEQQLEDNHSETREGQQRILRVVSTYQLEASHMPQKTGTPPHAVASHLPSKLSQASALAKPCKHAAPGHSLLVAQNDDHPLWHRNCSFVC